MSDEPLKPADGEKTEEEQTEHEVAEFLHDVRQEGERMNRAAAADMDDLAAGAEEMRQQGSDELGDKGREWEASAEEHRQRADEWAKLDDQAGNDA
jgi:hypothetical protein